MPIQQSRRRFLALIGGLSCLPLIPNCAIEPQPISLAVHIWPGYEPTSLARALGWLDEKLVKLIEIGSAIESIKLLEEGAIDACGLTLDEVLRLREKGIPLSVILVCDISAGADMLLVRPGIKTLADIKGRRIGVEDGALGALMLYQVLLAAGLQPEDVQRVSIPVDKQADAWKRGEIDAAVSFEPGSSQIIKLGGNLLFDSRQIPELIFDVIAVRSSLLDQAHAEAFRHLVAAHLKALKYIDTNPDDAAYRMAPRFNLSPEQVMPTFKGLVLPDLENNIRLIASPAASMLKSASIVGDVMLKAGILRDRPNLDGLLCADYLPRQAL